MNQLTEIFKSLSDETRLRIMHLLYHQDLCVCELTDLLDLSQPKISKHIAKLRMSNLVNTKRNSQYIYYSINHEIINLTKILELAFSQKNELLVEDFKRLKSIESFVCKER